MRILQRILSLTDRNSVRFITTLFDFSFQMLDIEWLLQWIPQLMRFYRLYRHETHVTGILYYTLQMMMQKRWRIKVSLLHFCCISSERPDLGSKVIIWPNYVITFYNFLQSNELNCCRGRDLLRMQLQFLMSLLPPNIN